MLWNGNRFQPLSIYEAQIGSLQVENIVFELHTFILS